MPALPNQPNVLKYETVFQIGSDTNVRTRMYFTYAGTPPTASDCGALATTAATYASNNMPQVLHPDNRFSEVTVTDLTTPSSAFGSHAAANPGNMTGAPLSANACVLQNFTINRRYRGGKPRCYWPFGDSISLATPQTWTPAFINTVGSILTGYIGAITGSASGGTTVNNHVNISYYSGFTPVVDGVTGRTEDRPKVRTTAIPPDVITGSLVSSLVGSQRRRIRA